MQAWDQRRVESRTIETMRRVAREAMDRGDDDAALQAYAEAKHLTLNEIFYYWNAYESGGEAGLQAIHNPDIIPPEVARRAIKKIASKLEIHFEGELPYRLTDEGTAVGVYRIKQQMSGHQHLFPVCQLRLTVDSGQWHLYWMREMEVWWPYPAPESGRLTLEARIRQVLENDLGCFWG